MDNPALLLTILLPPFVGAVILGLFGRYLPRKVPGIIGCAMVLVSLAAAVRGFLDLQSVPGRLIEADLGVWFSIDALTVRFHFILDPLSSFMALVVTGVGFLIHLYSTGYMSHEDRDERFFAFMNLFTGAMLTLVLGASLPLMFIGWEGVGLCSYLLIGYWFTDSAKAAAGMKAFIVNRIGDLGFLIGIFLLVHNIGTVNFLDLSQPELFQTVSGGLLAAIGLCLFLGATGKSAQIPLYVWLPDAMAGPTPVSALIHAATMVTAGVYMVGRLGVFFAASGILTVVAVVGVVTALFAATMAITERDIKKVLAYSTVSQLGFMFLAMGVGAYSSGIFHVYTHAFFKALLFLAAGSVIHALHGEQDIRKMGGLFRKLPVTGTTFVLGALALAGLPLFSGYLSKDEILLATKTTNVPLWLLAEITALLTAFYVGRLVWLVFFGKPRIDQTTWAATHESPLVMTGPLVALAVGAVLAGVREPAPPGGPRGAHPAETVPGHTRRGALRGDPRGRSRGSGAERSGLLCGPRAGLPAGRAAARGRPRGHPETRGARTSACGSAGQVLRGRFLYALPGGRYAQDRGRHPPDRRVLRGRLPDPRRLWPPGTDLRRGFAAAPGRPHPGLRPGHGARGGPHSPLPVVE